MGSKYTIYGFNYPFQGVVEQVKQTKFFIVAVFWMAVACIKYDGVNVNVRR